MSWSAQVVHIMRKDAREARWPIATYATIVLLSTARALGWPATSNNLLGVSMLFVVSIGVFVVAALVQADSPTRADAFWASRPFYPSAMLAAKLLLAAIIVAGPALLGQLAAISRFDLSAGTLARLIGKSASNYTMWLIVSMVVAAVTRDLRTFVVTIITIPVFDAIAAAAFSWFPAMSGAAQIGLMMLSVAGGLVLLAVLYRTRDVRRRTWVATFCIVTGVFYALFGELRAPAAIADSAAPPRDFGLKLEVLEPETIVDRARVRLAVRLEGPPPTERLTFDPQSMLIHLRNGKTLRTTIEHLSFPLFTPRLPTAPNIQWPTRDFMGSSVRHDFVASVTNDDRRAIREGGGVTGVVIEGTVIAMAPLLIATIPLARGASAARGGTRVDIDKVTHDVNDAVLVVHERSIPVDEHPARPLVFVGGSTLGFALLNTSRGEARSLHRRKGSSQGASLVLPGIDLHDETSQVQTESDNKVDERVDDAWMRGAMLIVADWVMRGRYSVRVETSVP